jgi:dTMP kinase
MSAFWAFEGLDGCGKSTQIRMLVEYLKRRGFLCESPHFPRTTGSFFAGMIARFLRGEFGGVSAVPPEFVAVLYAGDRADARNTIRTWLQNGSYVVADRYVYSNMAFQGAKVADDHQRSHLRGWIECLEFEYHGIERPDLSIFLDVPFDFVRRQLHGHRSGEEREYLNGKEDIHESSLSLQERVRAEYVALCAEREDLVLLPCASSGRLLTPAQIHNRVLELLGL